MTSVAWLVDGLAEYLASRYYRPMTGYACKYIYIFYSPKTCSKKYVMDEKLF